MHRYRLRSLLTIFMLMFCMSQESFAVSGQKEEKNTSVMQHLDAVKLSKGDSEEKPTLSKKIAKNKVNADNLVKTEAEKGAKIRVEDSAETAFKKQNDKISEDQWDNWLKSSKKQIGVGVSGSLEKRINALDGSNLLDDPSGVLAEEELNEGL